MKKESKKISRGDTNRYIVTDPAGNEYEVNDLNEFCKERGLWPSNMRKVAQGKSKSSKGWLCRYAELPNDLPPKTCTTFKVSNLQFYVIQ